VVVARKVPRLMGWDDIDCVDFWIGLGGVEYALVVPARATTRRAMIDRVDSVMVGDVDA